MSEKKNRNGLIILFFIYALLTVLYIINIFGIFGLVFWEVAFIFAIPGAICIIWALRRIIGVKKRRIQKYRHPLVVFTLIIFIFFSIFAIIPFLYVIPLGTQFDNQFKAYFGEDYYNQIPEVYRNRIKAQGNYYDLRDVRYFINNELTVQSDIPYGSDEYQKFDVYEDTSITGTNKPAVLVVHGGGSTTFTTKTSLNYAMACRYFASLGFVSFSIEYTPAPIINFPKGVADVMKAIVHIKNNSASYGIDNNSIVLFGSSRGGHLVTQCAYTGVNNDDWWRARGGNYTASELKIACVVNLYGAVDQFYGAQIGQFIASRNEIIFGGTPDEKNDTYWHHTVKNYVSSTCPPTLTLHGTIDGMVNIGESHGLVEALNAKNAPNIFLEVPFGQHGFEAIPGTPGNCLAYYFISRFILMVLFG